MKEEAKRRGLKQTGNKQELIDKIKKEEDRIQELIASQPPKPKAPTRSKSPIGSTINPVNLPDTYFGLLPGDIKNMVNKEREKAEINTKMLMFMMKDIINYKKDDVYLDGPDNVNEIMETIVNPLNEKFRKYGVDAELDITYYPSTKEDIEEGGYFEDEKVPELIFNYQELPIVSDLALMDLLRFIYLNGLGYIETENVNGRLTSLGINIRLAKVHLPLTDKAPRFENGKFVDESLVIVEGKVVGKKKAAAKRPATHNLERDYWEIVRIYPETLKHYL